MSGSVLARVVLLAVSPLILMGSLRAQEGSKPEDSFEVEPPLLIPPGDVERKPDAATEAPLDAAQVAQQLVRARKSVASAERLVKIGALAKVEAEQRALRVLKLEAELAKAQLLAEQAQVQLQQTQNAADHASPADLDSALTTFSSARKAAQAAEEKYRQAELDAAALNLHRQKRLLAVGAARKSDVARAEEKLATLQRGEEPAR